MTKTPSQYRQMANTMAKRQAMASHWGTELTKAGARVYIMPVWGKERLGLELAIHQRGFTLEVPFRSASCGWHLHWQATKRFPPAFMAALFPTRAVHLSPRVMNKFYLDHDEAFTAATTGIKILVTHLTDLTASTMEATEERT